MIHYINNQHKLCRAFYFHIRTYNTHLHNEWWKCDLLKATTDDAPDED